MKKSIIILSVFFLVNQIQAEPELKGSVSELTQYLSGVPKLVSIVGEGEIKVPADEAVVTLKVTSENRSLQTALKMNHELRTKLANDLKEQGIPADRIQAAKFASTPKFGWISEKAKSYRIENLVKVTVRDEKEFQLVAGQVDNASQVQYVGAEMRQSSNEELKQRAMAKACENAKEKQKIYEDKFGVRLVAKRFNEGTFQARALFSRGAAFGRPSFGAQGLAVHDVSAMPADAENEEPQFGEMVYTTQVVVEFALESK